MKQKRNVAQSTYYFEKDMNNDCISCGNDIAHPLCPGCIAPAFEMWAKEFPEHRQLISHLRSFMRSYRETQGRSKPCVSCKRSVHVCPLCFTSHLYNLVKEAGLGIRATTQFLFMFNFDFKHNNYSRELELYGGY